MMRVRIYANFIDEYYSEFNSYVELELEDNNDVKSLYYYIVRGLDYEELTREEIEEVVRCDSTSCLDMLEDLWRYGIIFDYLLVGDVKL